MHGATIKIIFLSVQEFDRPVYITGKCKNSLVFVHAIIEHPLPFSAEIKKE